MLLAVAVATCGVMPAFLTGGLAVQVREQLGFGEAALGLAVALFFTSSALASAVFGRVVERIGAQRGMQIAAVGSALSLLGIAIFARSWSLLVVWLVLGGFANALAHPATHLLLAREIPAERQGFSFGLKQSAIPMATLLAGLAVPTLAITVGWRWAFVGGAGLSTIVALLIVRKRARSSKWITKPLTNAVDVPRLDVGRLPIVLLALGIGLGSAAATPLGAFIVESSVAAGFEVGRAGLLLALASAVGIMVRILLGYLADGMRGGLLRLVAAMLAIGGISFVLLATRVDSLLVVGTMMAFGAGWGWPGIFNFAIVKTNPGAPAAATGITQTGASGGAALGPLTFGLVLEASSYTTAWLTSGTIALLAAITILTARHLHLRGRSGS